MYYPATSEELPPARGGLADDPHKLALFSQAAHALCQCGFSTIRNFIHERDVTPTIQVDAQAVVLYKMAETITTHPSGLLQAISMPYFCANKYSLQSDQYVLATAFDRLNDKGLIVSLRSGEETLLASFPMDSVDEINAYMHRRAGTTPLTHCFSN